MLINHSECKNTTNDNKPHAPLYRFLPILVLCLSSLFLEAHSSVFRFTNLTTKDGLSSNGVTGNSPILQDSHGFVWIGTQDGLNRYDGYEFKIYKNQPGNPYSLSDSFVTNIFEDSNNTLWIQTYNSILHRYDYTRDEFIRFQFKSLEGEILQIYTHSIIEEDVPGVLWLVDEDHQLINVNTLTGQFTRHLRGDDNVGKPAASITTLFTDNYYNLWIGTTEGVEKFQVETESTIKFVHDPKDTSSMGKGGTEGFYQDKKGRLWISTDSGLSRYNYKTKQVRKYPVSSSLEDIFKKYRLRSVAEDKYGWLWIALRNEGGLIRFDPDSGEYSHIQRDKSIPSSLCSNFVRNLYISSSDQIWAGTVANGVCYSNINTSRFGHIQASSNKADGLTNNLVTALLSEKRGNLWVGTMGGGLHQYNPETKQYSHFRHDSNDPLSLPQDRVSAIFEDRFGSIWIGLQDGEFSRFDRLKKHFVRYKNGPRKVTDIDEDLQGNIWITSLDKRLSQLNKKTNKVIHYHLGAGSHYKPDNKNEWGLFSIAEASNGNLWLGNAKGLILFDPENKTSKYFFNQPEDSNSLGKGMIISLYEDTQENVWIGMVGNGLTKYNTKKNQFTSYKIEDGLAGNIVYSIEQDQFGYLWAATDNGLSKIDPKTMTFRNYREEDGLQGNDFNMLSSSKSISGELYFGGNNGFNYFRPQDIVDMPETPRIIFTDFKLFNESALIEPQRVATESDTESELNSLSQFRLEKSIYVTKQLTLSHRESFFTFEFSVIDIQKPDSVLYAYQLEGWDERWIETDVNNRRANYTNIPPGNYVLRVKAGDSNGVWKDVHASINVTINPPWWRTWWAYLIYLVSIGTITMVIFRQYYHRKLAERDRISALEVASAKENLFANISHEFRTPLTLILGPSASIKQETNDQKIKSNVSLIERNAKRLLNMVDQVLDLAKLQGTKDQAKTNQGVSETVEFLVHSFQSLVEEKQIELNIDYSVKDDLYVSMVPDALTKILTNLLSNAFKYTPSGGKVIIKVDKDSHHYVLLSIRDTGCGIGEEDQSTIFERFTRLQKTEDSASGTGIGLALVKQLVESHKGTITVSSQLEVGSEFIVSLPLVDNLRDLPEAMSQTSSNYINEMVENINIEQPPKDQYENHSYTSQHNNPLVLIIEDNKDMRHFIKSAIASEYNIIESSDGEAGVKLAIERVPDLIISDVMMPKMDGYEVARTLKSNHVTSHIPLVLLTAKGDDKSRIRGWQENVDEYLTKPFDSEELLIRMNNLLSIRELLRERFNQQLHIPNPTALNKTNTPGEIGQDWVSAEHQFMERYNQVLDEYFAKPNLKVGTIAKVLHMTERQLSRKIKSLLNTTPSSYLRNFRLEKASILLKQGQNIGEVAFSVGFSSHSYFGRYFKAKYGVSPKEYRAKSSWL